VFKERGKGRQELYESAEPFLVVRVEQKILHERRTSELRIQKDTPSTVKC